MSDLNSDTYDFRLRKSTAYDVPGKARRGARLAAPLVGSTHNGGNLHPRRVLYSTRNPRTGTIVNKTTILSVSSRGSAPGTPTRAMEKIRRHSATTFALGLVGLDLVLIYTFLISGSCLFC